VDLDELRERGRELNEAELAALKDEWAREQAAADP